MDICLKCNENLWSPKGARSCLISFQTLIYTDFLVDTYYMKRIPELILLMQTTYLKHKLQHSSPCLTELQTFFFNLKKFLIITWFIPLFRNQTEVQRSTERMGSVHCFILIYVLLTVTYSHHVQTVLMLPPPHSKEKIVCSELT